MPCPDTGSKEKDHCFKASISFPKPLVVPYTWLYAPRALSLSDAVNYVSQHEERCTWGQASQISLERTYWWGVTLCPPELNDVSLAESVVILMIDAAIKEMNLNTSTPHPRSSSIFMTDWDYEEQEA